MPEALVDFEAVYDGRLVELQAGRDWVSRDCEIFQRFPQNFERFEREGGKKHAIRRRSVGLAEAPTRPRSSTELAVKLRNVAPIFEVDLGYSVRLAIEEEISAVVERIGNVETGGFLFGHQRPRSEFASACHASGPGKSSRHSRSGLKLASLRTVESEFSEVVARAGLRPVGDWHSHPASPGAPPDPRPSPDDLRGWARQREALGVSRYVGLIVTPGELGWMEPDFHAYVSYRANDWHIGIDPAEILHVCEPATLSEV
jgi:hypothetical protein